MSAERQPPRLDPNKAVRKYVERGAQAWRHRQTAADLYRWADVMRFFFFKPQTQYQPEMPNLVVGIEPMRLEVLAAYHLKENAVGLPYEITFNERYISRPLWETLETLVHEMTHLYQENIPGLQPSKNGYHNAQFLDIAEQIGLHPRLGSGAHWRPADGQFARLMEHFSVPKPDYAKVVPPETPRGFWWDEDRGRHKGKSTLVLYTSESCTRKPVCKVRSGRDDLQIRCDTCGGGFKPQT